MNTATDSWPKRHLITVDEYYRMAEVGLLAPDARVELIEGVIIDMAPIGSMHGGVVDALTRFLVRAAGDRAIVGVQRPLRLSNRSEPQPDVTLLKPRDDFYRSRHPTAADTLLVIEVSDSTLKFDLGEKRALYARHGVPELWVMDIQRKYLHCMRKPAGESYEISTTLDGSSKIEITALPDVEISLATVLG